MSTVLFAALALVMVDLPRIRPVVPTVTAPWMERGTRHARRRDQKLKRN